MGTNIRARLLAAALACFAGQCLAATDGTAVDFTASQSLWGSGGAASFGASESLDLGPVTFSYDIGASTGTVDAAFRGTLWATHAEGLAAPGSTAIALSFAGAAGGGRIASDLGAWINVNAIVDLIDKDFGLNVDQGFVPTLGQKASGSDRFEAVGVGIDVGIAKVGAGIGIEQTDVFTARSIGGDLAYGLRGSDHSTWRTLPFTLASSAELPLALDLGQPGIWDFAYVGLTLDHTFATSFDTQLTLYEEHPDGVKVCYKRVLGVRVPYPCGLTFDGNELQLADIDLYSADPQTLAFGTIDTARAFSIAVGMPIPEPGTFALTALGLALLGGFRAARRRA